MNCGLQALNLLSWSKWEDVDEMMKSSSGWPKGSGFATVLDLPSQGFCVNALTSVNWNYVFRQPCWLCDRERS